MYALSDVHARKEEEKLYLYYIRWNQVDKYYADNKQVFSEIWVPKRTNLSEDDEAPDLELPEHLRTDRGLCFQLTVSPCWKQAKFNARHWKYTSDNCALAAS